MEKHVLSIEQMQELISMGIDTSKASMYWYESCGEYIYSPNYNDITSDCIPTFTLHDIINLLPHHIEEREIGRFDYELIVRKDEVSYDSWEVRSSDGYNLTLNGYDIYNGCETLLDCAFEMLKWVKKEKYI